MVVVADFRRAAAGRDTLLRVQDAAHAGRWADVAACEWGMAMLWNDDDGSGGDSFGTLGDQNAADARPCPQPGGDDLVMPRSWFVPAGQVIRAVAVYVETGKLWRGGDVVALAASRLARRLTDTVVKPRGKERRTS